MDAVLAKPNLFTSLASYLYPHRLATIEQVSKSAKTSSQTCNIWSSNGTVAKQVRDAIDLQQCEGRSRDVESLLGLMPWTRCLLFDRVMQGVLAACVRDLTEHTYDLDRALQGVLAGWQKFGSDAQGEHLRICLHILTRTSAWQSDDVAHAADASHTTFRASLIAILSTAGCKGFFAFVNRMQHGGWPIREVSEGPDITFVSAEIEVALYIHTILGALNEKDDPPLSSMKVAQLRSLAKVEGVKRPGLGWAVCCPPDGGKRAVIEAIESRRAGLAAVPALASGDAESPQNDTPESGSAPPDHVEVAVADEEPSLSEQHSIPRDGSGDVGDLAGAQKDIAAKVRFLVIELNKSSKRIDDVLLGSELAVNAAEQGGELQPEWANGAKVFQTGVMPEHVAHVALSNRFVIIPIEKEETLNLLMFQLSSNERPRKKKRVDDAARVLYADARDDLSVPYADALDDIIYFVNRTFVEVLVPGEEYATASNIFCRSVSAPSLS